MSSIYDKSSLVLIPSGTKSGKVFSQKPVNGDGDFTFSRSTAATRVNADGNIEKETQNLLRQSNSFDTTWSENYLVRTSGQSGYDGSNDAWKLQGFSGTAEKRIRQSTTTTGIVTLSVYAKAGTINFLWLRGVTSSINVRTFFDLSNGTIGGDAAVSSKITDVGGGWYRCEATFNQQAGFEHYIGISDADGSASTSTTGYIYIQDAQLEQGLVARDVITTTTAAVEGGITDNVPRLDYTDSSCPALLLEPQRTNKESNSELLGTFSNSIIRLVNDTTSPEGLVNANKIVEASATARHEIYSDPISFGGNDHIVSFFGKADERRYVSVFLAGDPAYGGATFDLQAGTISQTSGGTTANVEDYGNGWYRCSFSVNYPSSTQLYICMRTADNDVNVQTYAGDGTSGFHIWGMQIEQGSYATSYIPTYGTSVTRNEDTATSNLQITNTNNFSIYIEFDSINKTDEGDGASSITFPSTTGGYWGRLYPYYTNEAVRWLLRGDGVSINIYHYYNPASTKIKTLITYDGSDYKVYANGSLKYTWSETAYTMSTGQSFNITRIAIEGMLTFNQALSNEEAIALTTI